MQKFQIQCTVVLSLAMSMLAASVCRAADKTDAPLQPSTLPRGDWKLTWADEFDGDQLDKTKWNTGYRFVDIVNKELQAYVPDAVSVGQGVCTIKVENREAQNQDQYGNKKTLQHFTSGVITTYEKFAQKYGYFEARVKMSSGPGTWPAFWLLPDRGSQVTDLLKRVDVGDTGFGWGSEIDIFEFMPCWKSPDGLFLAHSGIVWDYRSATRESPLPHGIGSYTFKYADADTKFHTYGLYWAADQLIYFIDGKPTETITDARHISAVPGYVILNVALSTDAWGMGQDHKNPTIEQIKAGMPSAMVVDYVRVYSGTLEK